MGVVLITPQAADRLDAITLKKQGTRTYVPEGTYDAPDEPVWYITN